MKKIIFIGPIGCGKTTVSKAILGEDLTYKKTQAIELLDNLIVDTPGEYLERMQMRGALMITSAEAEIIGLVQSATDEKMMFPPCYAGSFAKEVIGVITKTDIATQKQIEDSAEKLKIAGASKIFRISSITGEGLDELKVYLED